jgi:UDP-glucose 4-epimerase
MKTALIVGGAGYIGQHLQKELKKNGYIVHVLDKKPVERCMSTKYFDKYIECNILRNSSLYCSLQTNAPDGKYDVCFHLASLIEVGESEKYPTNYYTNNVTGTINLVRNIQPFCNKIIFSSSAGIYDELGNENPKSVYGKTKLFSEKILFDSIKEGMNCVALRYFNVAGADPDFEFGENHCPESHLIPNILTKDDFTIFGNDYDTPDGTCIRDYIHVTDLCIAHIKSAEWLISGNQSAVFDLGSGSGYSVKEVVDAVREVTGLSINAKIAPRRPGDPMVLRCDNSLAEKHLGFKPKYNLNDIIRTAHQWEVIQKRKPT